MCGSGMNRSSKADSSPLSYCVNARACFVCVCGLRLRVLAHMCAGLRVYSHRLHQV